MRAGEQGGLLGQAWSPRGYSAVPAGICFTVCLLSFLHPVSRAPWACSWVEVEGQTIPPLIRLCPPEALFIFLVLSHRAWA